MANILLVEDSETSRLVVTRALNGPDIHITEAETLALAQQQIRSQKFDLILLDLVLPDGDGLDILNTLQTREEYREIPVFLLTSKEDMASKVSAFSLGADDYLTKPINPIELRARVEMRLKKVGLQKKEMELLRRGGVLINLPMMQAYVRIGEKDQAVDLTAKEFKILAFLAQNENKVYSRADLVRAIWGNSTHVVERTIDSHVCGLRKKIQPFSSYIESIPGSGYRLSIKKE